MYNIFLFLYFFFFCSVLVAQKDTIKILQLIDKAETFEQNQPEKALKIYNKTFNLSLKANYNKGIYKSLQYSGIIYADKGNYKLALEYYEKAKIYMIKAKYKRGIGTNYINIANIYQFKGDYSNAIKNYLIGIKIFESIKDSSLIGQSYKNLSGIYNDFKNNDLKYAYLKKAIQYMPKANIIEIGELYTDIGLVSMEQDKFDEALIYLKKAETISVNGKNDRLLFFVTRNYGEYHKFKDEYLEAIPYYEKALRLIDNQYEVIQKNDLLYILSDVHLRVGNYSKALELANKSLKLSKKIESNDMIYKSLKRLSDIYNKLKKPQKAYQYLVESNQLKDSIFSQNHLKEITLLQTQFETEKKDKSIAEQKVKLKKQELDLIKSQKEKQIYFIVSLGLILLSLGIWYFYRQRQKIKNKEIIALQQQQEIAKLEALIDGEEKERRRIAQELHDGLNGDLSAIKYRLSTLEESGLSAIDTENLTKVINMIDESCAQVRSISHNLMPSSILEYGLVETVKEYCVKINNSDSFKMDFQTFGNYISLSKKTETVIYRIIQELVTNILKHSKATEAMIQFNYREEELFITVEDNGIGFDKNIVSNGIGHKNIQTRIDFLNAQLDVDSSSTGTSHTISIDLNNVK